MARAKIEVFDAGPVKLAGAFSMTLRVTSSEAMSAALHPGAAAR